MKCDPQLFPRTASKKDRTSKNHLSTYWCSWSPFINSSLATIPAHRIRVLEQIICAPSARTPST